MASKAYDFRLRFWDRFLGSFLNASSSKVTSLRAALRAEFWSHRNSTFWEPQCRPQSFRSLVGLLCAPILVTRFASRVRAPVSVALRTPKLDPCTFRALYHEAGLVSGIWACKLGRKTSTKSCLTVNIACAQLPLHDCTHRLDAHLDYNAKGQ